jgi:uncharacterized protein
MKYDLKIRNRFGNLLEVRQELPEKGLKFPTILMVPGFGADLHEYGYFDDVSDILVKNGFQTFRFSFEGCGKSEGNFIDMTVDKQAQQIHDLLDYIKVDRYTNIRKIGIFAHSFGGPTVIASLPFKSIKTFIFTGLPIDPADSLARLFKRQRGYDPEGISQRERSDNRITKIGSQFWKNLEEHNFIVEIKQIDKPVLLIHGSKDRNVKYWNAEDCYKVLTCVKRLEIINLADHGFTGKHRPIVLRLIKEWFLEKL